MKQYFFITKFLLLLGWSTTVFAGTNLRVEANFSQSKSYEKDVVNDSEYEDTATVVETSVGFGYRAMAGIYAGLKVLNVKIDSSSLNRTISTGSVSTFSYSSSALIPGIEFGYIGTSFLFTLIHYPEFSIDTSLPGDVQYSQYYSQNAIDIGYGFKAGATYIGPVLKLSDKKIGKSVTTVAGVETETPASDVNVEAEAILGLTLWWNF